MMNNSSSNSWWWVTSVRALPRHIRQPRASGSRRGTELYRDSPLSDTEVTSHQQTDVTQSFSQPFPHPASARVFRIWFADNTLTLPVQIYSIIHVNRCLLCLRKCDIHSGLKKSLSFLLSVTKPGTMSEYYYINIIKKKLAKNSFKNGYFEQNLPFCFCQEQNVHKIWHLFSYILLKTPIFQLYFAQNANCSAIFCSKRQFFGNIHPGHIWFHRQRQFGFFRQCQSSRQSKWINTQDYLSDHHTRIFGIVNRIRKYLCLTFQAIKTKTTS